VVSSPGVCCLHLIELVSWFCLMHLTLSVFDATPSRCLNAPSLISDRLSRNFSVDIFASLFWVQLSLEFN